MELDRFSASFKIHFLWSKILPSGEGEFNLDEFDKYNEVINECINNGLTPYIVICSGDLPAKIKSMGGWSNRDILMLFAYYVGICVEKFKDRVHHWILFNNPNNICGSFYFLGLKSKYRYSMDKFIPNVHHILLCHSVGFNKIKKIHSKAIVGTNLLYTNLIPINPLQPNVASVNRADCLLHSLFVEPFLGLGYPYKVLPFLSKIKKYFLEDDLMHIIVNLDFISLDFNENVLVKHNSYLPFTNASIISNLLGDLNNKSSNINYNVIKKFSDYENINKIIIIN